MSAYAKAVAVDAPLAYWKLQENSGAEQGGGTALALTGTAADPAGPPIEGEVGATSFDGIDDSGQVPLNLSGLSEFTTEFWLRWDTNGADDDFAMEHSANANSNTGFNVDWNNSTGGAEANTVSVKWLSSGGLQAKRFTFPRPSAGTWHHVVLVLVVNGSLVAYVDGQVVPATQRETAVQTGTFSNTNLNLMSRNRAALFGAGDLAHLAIYGGSLSKARVEVHWNAAAENDEAPERHGGASTVGGGGEATATGSRSAAASSVVAGGGTPSAGGRKHVGAASVLAGGGGAGATGAKRGTGASAVAGGGEVTATGGAEFEVAFGASSVEGGGSVASTGRKRAAASSVVTGGGAQSARGKAKVLGLPAVEMDAIRADIEGLSIPEAELQAIREETFGAS